MITPSFGLTATERVLPKLALDFTTALLDSRVTFTRTTDATHPATYINSSGVVTAATNDQPRFDHDPVTLACKGLLIEESRANLLKQSNAFSTSPWLNIRASSVVSSVIGPDGVANAFKLTEDSSVTSTHVVAQDTTNSNATYTFSVYLKAGERTRAAVWMSDLSTAAVGINVNLSTGAFTITTGGSWTSISGSVTDAGNGWWRCVTTATRGAGTGTSPRVLLADSAGNTTYSGNGTSGLYIWGAQLEVGAFATSYIPTTTAALTRNADVATMTGTNFSSWFNASEGTFVAKYIPNDPTPSNARGLFIADDGTGNNLVGVSVTTTLRGILSLATGGSGAGAITANSGTVNQVNTVAGAYKVNDYTAALNGGTVGTSTSLTLPAVTQARIGFLARTGLYANATIQKLAFYPVRGINAQVQAQSK